MGSTAVAASQYWGYLIKPDKSPSLLLEKLLLGIANYIVSTICRSSAGSTSADRFAPTDNKHLPMGHPIPDSEQACSLLSPCRRQLRWTLSRDSPGISILYISITGMLPFPSTREKSLRTTINSSAHTPRLRAMANSSIASTTGRARPLPSRSSQEV